MANPSFDQILIYLGLGLDYLPSPTSDPVTFLDKHIHQLPPHLLLRFSSITSPKQRTSVVQVRNRRTKYAQTRDPQEFSFNAARSSWPILWQGRGPERREGHEANDERQWVEETFLPGLPKHVGKLASLLGGYEEDRDAERVRTLRRQHAEDTFRPEEDDSDSEEEESIPTVEEEESETQIKDVFLRRVKERFIYGLLEVRVVYSYYFLCDTYNFQGIDYDKVDWDESLDDDNDREIEERWFDEDD